MGSHLMSGSESEPAPEPTAHNSSLSDWSSFYDQIGGHAARPSATRSSSTQRPRFEGGDRLCLEEGWVLIKGENAFFLESACKGLDPSQELFSNALVHCALTLAAGYLLSVLKRARQACRLVKKDPRRAPMVSGPFSVPVSSPSALGGISFGSPYFSTAQVPMGDLSSMSLPVPTHLTQRPSILPSAGLGSPWGASMSPFYFGSGHFGAQMGQPFAYPVSYNSQFAFEIPWAWN